MDNKTKIDKGIKMDNELKINEGIIDLEERRMQMTNKNIKVLNDVKEILTIGKMDIITVKMCADYFDVTERYIRQIINKINDELQENGLKVYNKEEFLKEIKSPLKNDKQLHGKSILIFEDGSELIFPNRGLILMTKRTVLNIGMLLKKSKVAKELRRRILDVVHDAEEGNGDIHTIINEIDEEKELKIQYVDAMMSGDITKMNEINAKLFEMKNKRIVELEDIVSNSLTIKDSRQIINKCVRAIAHAKYHDNFAVAWSDLYKMLNYKLGINIKNRKGKGLNKFSDDEIKQIEMICKGWCDEFNIDINLKL